MQINTNNNTYKAAFEEDLLHLNDQSIPLDIAKLKEGHFSIIHNDQTFDVVVVDADYEQKAFTIKVNNQRFTLTAKTDLDLMLEKLGMNTQVNTVVSDIKAPMPGLILTYSVEEGQEISKGTPLLILEAMKMENVIKSPRDGVIKKLNRKAGENVEKNTVLVSFQ
ncbi:acetyl-CoA carboxylase biotin carboxyl carrier protein subunit [Algivirga pacifica]|uniref:Acetyl-CoA carboxylase biotin carboxyl carrier protein subunit n=1 Tax=Algivirga pacifica TaxID=1162670 RepID=A0ABP9DD26_9BACT